MAIDLNQMAQSFYSTFQQLNQIAVETVGIDVKWCRSVPYENSEDVILQEYTLLNVECPKDIRIVTSKTDYNPGALQVDFFGINYEAPMEVSITTADWQNVYGKGSQPQKDDIVYIPLLNKLFQVASATVDYGWAEQPTGFKCQLVKYNPHASRRESEEMMQSIEDMTVSQERLFGEELSKHIADLTDPEQFNPNISTYREPYKDFDMNIVITEDIIINGNITSRSHYNFINSKSRISYFAEDNDTSHNWRLFTCWMRIKNSVEKFYNVEIKELYNKNKTYWQLKAKMAGDFEIGDEITLTRGKNIKLSGTINSKHDDLYIIDIPTPEALRATKLITNWYNIKGYTISGTYKCNIFNSDNLNIQLKNNKIYINDILYNFSLMPDKWYFISLQMNLKSNELKIFAENEDSKLEELASETKAVSRKDFINSNFGIENINIDFDLTNIRYYMTTRKTSVEHIKQDALSRFTKSNSLSIILDNAEIPNKETYIGISK